MMYWFLGAGFGGDYPRLGGVKRGESLRWAKTGWLIGLSFLLGRACWGGWWQSRPTAPAASQQLRHLSRPNEAVTSWLSTIKWPAMMI